MPGEKIRKLFDDEEISEMIKAIDSGGDGGGLEKLTDEDKKNFAKSVNPKSTPSRDSSPDSSHESPVGEDSDGSKDPILYLVRRVKGHANVYEGSDGKLYRVTGKSNDYTYLFGDPGSSGRGRKRNGLYRRPR